MADAKTEKVVALRPVGENAMEATVPVKMIAGSWARVTVTLADKRTSCEELVIK